MERAQKLIRLSQHAQEQLAYRGTTEEEIRETIRTAPWKPAELDRLECQKEFPYNREWNKKVHKTKQVRPIFAEEPSAIVVITVYVYYS